MAASTPVSMTEGLVPVYIHKCGDSDLPRGSPEADGVWPDVWALGQLCLSLFKKMLIQSYLVWISV